MHDAFGVFTYHDDFESLARGGGVSSARTLTGAPRGLCVFGAEERGVPFALTALGGPAKCCDKFHGAVPVHKPVIGVKDRMKMMDATSSRHVLVRLPPGKTQAARELLAGPRSLLAVPMRMLLINVDGRGGTAELQDIARSLNFAPQALEQLQWKGLIVGLAEPAQAPTAVEEPAVQAKPAPTPTSAADDLRRLVRAKLFAFDLACRMLARRDSDFRASAREVDSESRFLDWLAVVSARIEVASDGERAQLFRAAR